MQHPKDRSPALHLSRRHVLAGGLAGTSLLLGAKALARAASADPTPRAEPALEPVQGPFVLTPLPWKDDALAPSMSANTLSFHYGKHHSGYVDKLNKAVAGNKKWDGLALTKVIELAAKDPADAGVFNNAAQTWNHTFFWASMKPGGGGEPTGRLADALKTSFGDFATFKKQFTDAASGLFGSGWTWLTMKEGKLAIEKTSNADTPIAHGGKPLLVLDVWEHAYYLDYQNKRADFIAAYLDKLVNWEFALANLAG
ncbi:MAG: superoxide dismutase [Planctomycetes bacterium]|nr:superoxide dismutase [Planctomycetota bacterium]